MENRFIQAFTIIEFLMVVLLVSIVSVVAVPQFIDMSGEAKEAVTNEKLRALKAAIVGDGRMVANGKHVKQGFERHCEDIPTALSQLITQPGAGTCATAYDPFTKRGWRGPYVSDTITDYNVDGWGTTIQYFDTGPPARTIRSCGPDATCGTGDDISLTF